MKILACLWISAHLAWSVAPAASDQTTRRRQNNRQDGLTDDANGNYWIGTGIHDITGPAAEVNMMGYGQGTQTTHGIHQRLWARAFIVSQNPNYSPSLQSPKYSAQPVKEPIDIGNNELEPTSSSWFRSLLLWPLVASWDLMGGFSNRGGIKDSGVADLDPDSTVCFVSIDLCMGSDILNTRVLDRLDELLLDDGKNRTNLCRMDGLTISATHTHSAPAGFLQYAVYQIQSLGFIPQVVDILIEGIAQALFKAHLRLTPGNLYMSEGDLFDANINRSPTSYLNNPQSERDEYKDHGDTDKRMLQILFESTARDSLGSSGDDSKDDASQWVGLLNWFAVHPTSMNSTNQLISGDNKGYASYLMERKYNPNGTQVGDEAKHTFIAAFASTNLGDVSPNTAGPRCLDSGLPCDPITSTCRGHNELCVAFGPGRDMFESTEIIGQKQVDKAEELLNEVVSDKDSTRFAAGPVKSRHSFVDMSKLNVTLASGQVVHTCPAAIGYGFAAGTIDGHGAFDFKQGSNSTNPFWNMVGGFLSLPSQQQIDCQAPKPILLNTGYIHLPYDWDPNTVPISIFQINNLFILNVPGEFTTMAGRRLRRAVHDILDKVGYHDARVTIAGLSNTYTHYITTFEEYQGQRYEAASTLYGPYTLDAYVQEFSRILKDLLNDKASESGPPPKDRMKHQISLLPSVVFDAIGAGRTFGSIVHDVQDSYDNGGNETARATFRSANPRNNPRIQDTFLTVEQLDDHGRWKQWLTDADWETKFIWRGGLESFGTSFADIHWKIAAGTPQGIYRICHFGTRRTLFGHAGEFLRNAPEMLGGSFAMNIVLSIGRFLFDLSARVRGILGHRLSHHYRDFHGCSSSFLVYGE